MNVLMIGTGEYTTGYVHHGASSSDKRLGVVALTLFDLRRRGRVDRILMAGTNGTKFPEIRRHLAQSIGSTYCDMDVSVECFPSDSERRDPCAYRRALLELTRGDVVTIFTPDDTHFALAMDAVKQGCHVLIAKPLVKRVDEHRQLAETARAAGVLVAMEVHKRWDPIYQDAHDRIRSLGDFSFFQSYMSQPKSQLETFRHWAGSASDISYYLNSHHIDFHAWSLAGRAVPVRVVASASRGWATRYGIDTEDTITLQVDWRNEGSGHVGTALYTASWIAPRSDVHSQQRFFYQGHQGEITVDQAHRGYSMATDTGGLASLNPLFMKYTPDPHGRFAGQGGYGYRSLEAFIEAAHAVEAGQATPSDFDTRLATVHTTLTVTAILEAGRRSLDTGLPQPLTPLESQQL